jgi:hypothetical protein
MKEAIEPAGPRSKPGVTPRDNAKRVIAGTSNLSPFPGERTIAGNLLERSVFVRELLPQDLKIEIEHLSRNEAMK